MLLLLIMIAGADGWRQSWPRRKRPKGCSISCCKRDKTFGLRKLLCTVRRPSRRCIALLLLGNIQKLRIVVVNGSGSFGRGVYSQNVCMYQG